MSLAISPRVVWRSAPTSATSAARASGAIASPAARASASMRDFERARHRRNSIRSTRATGEAFERGPQAGSLLELSRLDDDRAVGRRPGEQRLERRQEIAPLRVDPDRAGAAEHRDRIGFVGERAGIARDRVALEAHEPQRVRVGADQLANDGLHPLVRKSLVLAVDQVEADLLRQSLDEAVGGGAGDDAHRRRNSIAPRVDSTIGPRLSRHGEIV